jgi:hypothetical protein
MALVRTIRWLRASLLALFALAQIAGVVPLLHDHTLNVYEAVPVAAHAHAHAKPTVANPDADHHHGALDLHDQCCALHALAGPLPHSPTAAPTGFVGFRLLPVPMVTLTGIDPATLDRPPRSFPLS